MVTLERWSADESLNDVWEETTEDYLAELAAYNNELFAERRRSEEEQQDERYCWACCMAFVTTSPRKTVCDACLEHYAPAESSANLCPACEGSGTDVVLHGYARDWETGEWEGAEEVGCASCEGGLLHTPAGETEVALDFEAMEAWLNSRDNDYDVRDEAS